MHLYFIRHAQSANNALYASGAPERARTQDPPLTDLGRQQAELLAGFLAQSNPSVITARYDPQNRCGFGLTHLYCSLMVRAISTGSIIAARLGLPLHAWVDWHEEGGLFLENDAGERLGQPGYGRGHFAKEYPVLVLPETLGDDGWWNRPFEAAEDRPARARRVVAELLERHGQTDDRVAVISHGGFYNHFVAALLELNPPYKLSFLMNNAALARIAIDPRGNYVVYQNRCEYLPAELVTL